MNGRIDIVYQPPEGPDKETRRQGDKETETSSPCLLVRRPPLRKLRAAILVLAAVLVLRAVALEPFGVPTGSMAPTLRGVHRAVDCPRCGGRVVVEAAAERHYAGAACPNCGWADL